MPKNDKKKKKRGVSTLQMNNEIQIELADSSIFEIEKPGHKLESVFTVGDLSYTIMVYFVDLATVVSGVNLNSYSKSDTLIKYSEARFSPVSSEPANYIQFATPSYYRELKVGENSELIADDLEGAYIETLNWRSQGSPVMEGLKEDLAASPYGLPNNLSVEMKWARDNYWMYCTSINPNVGCRRKKQMKHLSPSYNFMTKIEGPAEFAKQLGRDVGKQIEAHNNLTSDQPCWHMLASARRRQSKAMGEYLIFVSHGPVIYLSKNKIDRLLKNLPERRRGSIIPFVKRNKYKEQQEYRFVIGVQFHSPNENTFYLEVSDELRNLMSPL